MVAYSSVYVIGDSLVDAGNALRLAEWYDGLPLSELPEGAPVEEDGYFLGRFTNGFTFADLLANKLVGAVTEPVFPYGFDDPLFGVPIDPFEGDPDGNSLNFAYGGAQIRQGDEVVPDLDGQTDALRDAVDNDFDPNALVFVTMGGNDVRNLVPSGSDPVPQAQAYAALDECAQQLIHELGQLIDRGVQHILLTGIPDVGLVPRYDRDGNGVLDAAEQARADAATDYSAYLDMLLRTEVVPALQAMGATVTYVPVMDHVDGGGNTVEGALSANLPTIAALNGLTADELTNNLLQHQHLLFFDGLHPTAQAHALLGAYMHAQLTGTEWVETLPLVDSDFQLSSTISAAGEVDTITIAMVAGTTYRFDMLGMSSLGTAGSLADPLLRLLATGGTLAASDDDSGAGFDSVLSFTAAATGNHTLQLSAVGGLTGAYSLQAAVIGGAAMLAGHSYTVTSGSTLVLEGAGGAGIDVVRASVSYALAAGSEIEELRTTNDRGKGAIDLTGNDFDQTIVGNAGSNVLDGRGGADTLFGGAGRDVFVLGGHALADPGSVDSIADYASGDVVDITQVLNVAAGTNVVSGGYLRVTREGLVQVDLDGGGDQWVTLSSISGTADVTFRYVSGGTATDLVYVREGGSGGGGGGGGGGGKPGKGNRSEFDGVHDRMSPNDLDDFGWAHLDDWLML